MASIIRIKRSATAGNPTTLAAGEFAYSSLADNGANGGDRLYLGTGTETNGDAANHEIIGGKYFTDKMDHAVGTLTASSAILVDANSKIDNIKVDNIDIDGNTISTIDTNGDLILNPNGNGFVNVFGHKIVNMPTPTSDSDASNKKYVDDAIFTANSAQTFSYKSEGGSATTLVTANDTLEFRGLDSDILVAQISTADSDVVTYKLKTTGITAGQYGSTTNIPRITFDSKGRATAADQIAISTTMATGADAGSGSVVLGTNTFTLSGTDPVQTTASASGITIAIDDATTSTKGVAGFNPNNFTVNAGSVTTKNITIGSVDHNLGDSVSQIVNLNRILVDNINIDGNTISTTDSGNSILILDPGATGNANTNGEVQINGSLVVKGTTTTVNSATLDVADLNITLAKGAGNAAAANGAGLTIDGASSTLLYNSIEDRMDFNKDVNLPTGKSFMINGVSLTETIDDQVDALIVGGTSISTTYDDGAGTLTVSADIGTTAAKGVVQMDSAEFNVTSGLVTHKSIDGGTY